MSGRVKAMEDGRARESECGEHGMDVLLVLLLSAVTFDQNLHDQFPRLVTKGFCAPVICLMKSLEQDSFRRRTIITQRVIFLVILDAGNIVRHDHGLNNGSNQILHGGGVPVMSDTRNHQRNAGASDFSSAGSTLQFGMKIWTRIGGSCLGLLPIPPLCQISKEKNNVVKLYTSCVVIGGYPAGLMQPGFLTASNDSML